jgi:hypothetical protein
MGELEELGSEPRQFILLKSFAVDLSFITMATIGW